MNSAARDSGYLFGFDAAPDPVVFGAELNLTGWLLQRDGKPIHGLRVLVRRPLSRKQIFRARRKRARPEVAVAYPELPDAGASGFLFELHLRFGRNHLTFQVLDHERSWQTFATASVTAVPLSLLDRIGFTHTRSLLVSQLQRRTEARRRNVSAKIVATTERRAPTRIDLFATTKSNLFMVEIGELVAAGFREVGIEAQLHLDQIPIENPPDDSAQIVVAPHEYHQLFLAGQVDHDRALALTKNVYLLCTEQPGTGWFAGSLEWAKHSLGVFDLSPLGVAAWRAQGIAARPFGLGFHPLLKHEPSRREYDITFLGSLTERREKFIARHGDFFANYQCHLRLVPLEFAKTKETRSYLRAEKRNELLSQSRILLNLHHGEEKYFEWHRVLLGLANGCCVVTETCRGYGRLVPNEHFVMVEPENLIDACEYYLAHADERERIAQAGQQFVERELRQSQMCELFLRALSQPSTADLPPDQSVKSLPIELRKKIARRTCQSFVHAIADDFRAMRQQPEPAATHRLPERDDLIKKREAYHGRFVVQEEARAKGEPVFELHDNFSAATANAPQVSVVITLYNYAQHIEECVASITRAAEQLASSLELVIVNDASTDDSLGAALRSLADSKLPTRVIDKKFNTGLADARNLGIEIARAPYLFMMDADNLVFPDALRQLLDAITKEDCSAAYSLLCRFRDRPENRVGLLSYFDWDPQILVQYPYIDAMALFRRDVLLQLGGYDNELNQIGWFGWEDYDLWLRFAQRNQRVAFVPNTLCLYRDHDTSMINATKLFAPELAQHFTARYRDVLNRFAPRPRVFSVDHDQLRIGLTRSTTRVFIASGCSIATTQRYRCLHLQEQLRQLGYSVEIEDWSDDSQIKPEAALDADVLFLYRLPMSASLQRVIEEARASNKPVIFDTDDLIFEPDLLDAQRGIQKLSEADQRLHAEGARRYLETLQACDGVITSTPALAELAARRNKRTFVHRNALGREMLAEAKRLHAGRKNRLTSERVVIGYGSGTPTHDHDFLEVADALRDVLTKFHLTELWIVGPLELPNELKKFGSRVRHFPPTDWREWFARMNEFDLALAPLETDNVFCQAKSEIKFVEAGALGVPVIASRSEPYASVITDSVDGLLAANETEWREALISLIEQPGRRGELGQRARETVLQKYSPDARTKDLEELLPHLLGAIAQPKSNRKTLTINWLVPEPFPGAGGDIGLFRIIRYLAEFGHDCRVHVVPYSLMNDFSSAQIRDYVREYFGPTPAQYQKWNGSIGDADCTFATFWPTAENLRRLTNGGRRYYLVQDFEPSFYPDDAHHFDRAENTYRAGFHCLTLGPWLAKLLRDRYGATADHFDFAVDHATYWPRPNLRTARRRLCFYARPSTPRRAYELGLQALALVHARLPEVEINFFGTDQLTPEPTFPFVNQGLLDHENLATLFSSCDVGLVLSLTNPSFVPLEMMACRCAVVEIASERYDSVLTHGQDAWLVEPNADAIADGIVRLLEDSELRARLVETARNRVRMMDWGDSARQIEAVLLRDAANAG